MEYLAYGLATASATVAGGLWVASRPRAWLSEQRLALLVALGAGVLTATLCFELLPTAVEHGGEHAFFWVFAGLTTIVLFERYLAPLLNALVEEGGPAPADALAAGEHDHGHGPCGHHHDHVHGNHAHGLVPHDHLLSHGSACSALGCLLVCTFFDGVAMMAGFSVSLEVGLLLSLGLILHLLPEGIMAATVVLAAGHTARAARRAALAVGGALMAGIGFTAMLGEALGFTAVALPFAAGVIMYVVLAELLPVARRVPLGIPLFLGAACLFGVIERLIPHHH